MAELSDSFKQLDSQREAWYARGNHRSIQCFKRRLAGPLVEVFSSRHLIRAACVNHDSSTPQLRRRISTTLHHVNMLYISIHPLDITTRGFCLALPFRVLSLPKFAHSRSH